jgi:hypothetical protein
MQAVDWSTITSELFRVEPESAVHVRKLRPMGRGLAWDGAVALRRERIVLRAEFNVDEVVREYATFRRGDVFVEFYYWSGRTTFQSAADGTLKGWYATRTPELEPSKNELRYVDLALDVWVARRVVRRPGRGRARGDGRGFPHVADIAERGRQEPDRAGAYGSAATVGRMAPWTLEHGAGLRCCWAARCRRWRSGDGH